MRHRCRGTSAGGSRSHMNIVTTISPARRAACTAGQSTRCNIGPAPAGSDVNA
jgi:hypothetical protein